MWRLLGAGLWFNGGCRCGAGASLHLDDEAFKILALGMIDVDRVVGRLVELVEYADVATAHGCRGEDGQPELLLADGV